MECPLRIFQRNCLLSFLSSPISTQPPCCWQTAGGRTHTKVMLCSDALLISEGWLAFFVFFCYGAHFLALGGLKRHPLCKEKIFKCWVHSMIIAPEALSWGRERTGRSANGSNRKTWADNAVNCNHDAEEDAVRNVLEVGMGVWGWLKKK